MIDLKEHIIPTVVVTEVLCHPGTLGHPVKPNGSTGIMYTISFYQDIDGSMKFNTPHFCPGKTSLDIDMMNMIPYNLAERGTHTAYDPYLLTPGNSIVAYYMAANRFPCSSHSHGPGQSNSGKLQP